MTFRVTIEEFRERVHGPADEAPLYRTVSSAMTLEVGEEEVLYREVTPPEYYAVVPEPYIRVQGWVQEIHGKEAVLRGIDMGEADRVVDAMEEANIRRDPAVFLDPDGFAYLPTVDETPVLSPEERPGDVDDDWPTDDQ